MTTNTEGETCKHCGRDIAIRNPKGYCDHLRYPEACEVCSTHKNIEGEKFTDNYFMATSGKNDIRRKDIKKAIIQATELERKRILSEIDSLKGQKHLCESPEGVKCEYEDALDYIKKIIIPIEIPLFKGTKEQLDNLHL